MKAAQAEVAGEPTEEELEQFLNQRFEAKQAPQTNPNLTILSKARATIQLPPLQRQKAQRAKSPERAKSPPLKATWSKLPAIANQLTKKPRDPSAHQAELNARGAIFLENSGFFWPFWVDFS